MASFFDRAEELRSLFGWEPADLYTALDLDRSTYARWKTGAVANREALLGMSRRFLISVDSLMALDGTSSLEPSPVLRKAQLLLLDGVLQAGVGLETAAQRLVLAVDLLQNLVSTLTLETWAAYLRTTVGGWLEISQGYRPPTEDNLAGAAHLLGWYDLRDAWLHWLTTGSLDRLKGPRDEAAERIMRRAHMMGVLIPDMVEAAERRLAARNGFASPKMK